MDGEKFATFVSQFLIIFGGLVPYIPQYLDIRRSRDATGFSTFVCFALILANTLRIAYWLGHHFNEALLLQSFIMLTAMFIMVDLCVKVERLRKQALQIPVSEHYLCEWEFEYFWGWTNLASYIGFTLGIAVIAGSLVVVFVNYPVVVEGMGYASLITESCIAIPQFLKNQKNRSVNGMNISMVLMWAIGDGFKLFFYLWKTQPLPFILCASIQLFMDFLICIQIAVFRN